MHCHNRHAPHDYTVYMLYHIIINISTLTNLDANEFNDEDFSDSSDEEYWPAVDGGAGIVHKKSSTICQEVIHTATPHPGLGPEERIAAALVVRPRPGRGEDPFHHQ